MVQVGYDGQNGKPYVPIGRLLVERGVLDRDAVSMQAIRAWIKANPEAGAALMAENPSYVFFREIVGDGPLGAQGVALTAERSLAVDRDFVPLGVPVWLDADLGTDEAAAADGGAGHRRRDPRSGARRRVLGLRRRRGGTRRHDEGDRRVLSAAAQDGHARAGFLSRGGSAECRRFA